MGTCLVKLNHSNIFSKCQGESINKLLKIFGVQMGILASKMPTAQWFHHSIEPEVVPLPLYLHDWLHTKSGNHLARFTLESNATFVLTQVAHSLALPKV
jgi:hypothetical protein